MNEILLVNTSYPTNPDRKFSSFGPPLGILQIASMLEVAGFKVTFCDPQLDPDFEQNLIAVLTRKPLFVGMSTYLGCNIQNAINMVSLVRQYAGRIPVIWGGPLASSLPEICLTQADIDYIVMGPGEHTIVDVATAIKQSNLELVRNHPHVSFKNADGTFKVGSLPEFDDNLDELPRINLQHWIEGVRKQDAIPILTSRGCPRRCSFCYNTFTSKGKYFLKSAPAVLAEMEHWNELTGCRNFHFIDDNFLVNEERAITIIQAAESRGWRILRVYGHLTDFRKNITELICNSHIGTVTMCVESGSPRIRKLLNKHIDEERALEVIKTITQAKIGFVTAFMFGLPGEDLSDIKMNLRLAKQIHDVSAGKATSMFYLYAPQPHDGIVAQKKLFDQLDFSLDAIAGVEVVPVPPDDHIEMRLHPWMDETDAVFYLALANVWLFHFNKQHRQKTDASVITDIYNRQPVIRELFEGL